MTIEKIIMITNGSKPITCRFWFFNSVTFSHIQSYSVTFCHIQSYSVIFSHIWPALVADLSARPPRGTFWCHVLALPPDRKGLSRLWVPLFGMIFPLNFVLCRVTFPVLFINSSRLSCLAESE